ncbi:MAG TPA: AAA family ATPase [Candidatus Limnocylindria bacterium]|nr:AAA family ATPase [Candidatus Limnocylindria bacterium]
MIYQAFYGLGDMPFRPTPDPRYLFASARHRLALSQLTYSVGAGTGLVVLTGEVGTGKTTLLRTLLQSLDATVPVAYVHNAALTMDGLVEYMLGDWGVTAAATTPAERLSVLHDFLAGEQARGRRPLLVVDEAHTLSVDTLQALGALPPSFLRILLVGQPELRDKLDLPELRHVTQRISQRCHLAPLSADEARLYVRHRLAVAGAPDAALFADPAIRKIAEYSEGTPRVINMVCDLCLVRGYANRTPRIDAGAVTAAIAYLEEGDRPAAGPRARLGDPEGAVAVWAARGGIAVLVVMLVGLLAFAVNAMGIRVPGTP